MTPILAQQLGLLVLRSLALALCVAGPAILEHVQARLNRRETHKDGLRLLHRLFRIAGVRLHLALRDGADARGPSLHGRIDGADVVATCVPRGPLSWTTAINVGLASRLASGIQLRSRWRSAAAALPEGDRPGTRDIRTGDPSFDALIQVDGSVPLARALLKHSARTAVADLARRASVGVGDGRLCYEILDRPWSPKALDALIRAVVVAARAFPALTDDVPTAVAELARQDPQAGVRARCLETLLKEYPENATTLEALAGALADASNTVRVIAAMVLGERGVAVLREIALCEQGEEEPTRRAINVLGSRLSTGDLLVILDAAAKGKRQAVALTAIEALGRADDAEARRRLGGLLRGSDETLAVVAAGALGGMPSPEAEPILIDALSARSAAVSRAAARALSQAGGPVALARLRALVLGRPSDREWVAIARQSIEAIRARLPGATSGQLSLADGRSGELSLAEKDASGRLSLTARTGPPAQAGTPAQLRSKRIRPEGS